MNQTLRNILAVIVGWLGGSIINMALVQTGHSIFPIEGLDPNDMDAFAAIMPSLDAKYFIFPFFAHALGTLAGAAIAAIIGVDRKLMLAFIVGGFFLIGGIAVNYLLPGPIWFTIVDILFAYIPMAWLGGKLVQAKG